MLWDDADRPAAGGEHGVGDHAHQADAPAAVDQAQAALSEAAAELARRLGMARIGACRRTAIDAHRADRCHEIVTVLVVFLSRGHGMFNGRRPWQFAGRANLARTKM